TRRGCAIASCCSAAAARGAKGRFGSSRASPRREAAAEATISKRYSLRSREAPSVNHPVFFVGFAGFAFKPFVWLLKKEYRELVSSRAWWVLLVAMGPLVGVTFMSAVRTYAEASGLNGTTAGVGEAFSPLIGIWAPTFSACEVAAVFLLPFVAIRLVAGDRQSGALKIEMQHPMSAFTRIVAKAIVLFAGWIVASAAPLTAIVLWKSYGGALYVPELLT